MPENPEKSDGRHPEKDRRLHARQRIHSLSYAKIGEGNGGIVLNISESGISVQAAGILDDSEPITLWLEIPRVRDRVEVTAEIVWLSASRKEAGLRFVNLPAGTLRHIQRWIAREASPEKFEDETEIVNEEHEMIAEATENDRADVRELTEASIMSADEIKGLESARNSQEQLAATEAVRESDIVKNKAAEGVAVEDEPEAETEIEAATAIEAKQEVKADEESTSVEQSETAEEIKSDTETETEIENEKEAEEESVNEEESETEDELIKAFGPPVVPFERRPNMPFSAMSASSGVSRGAQNLAIAAPFPRAIPKTFEEPVAALPESATGSDWKDFRVQLQTGWVLAALVLLLALISFIAGMAVRRGALNGVMGEQEDSLVPKSAPSPSASIASTNSATGSTGSVSVTPTTPLSIEIIDTNNRRWVIPASTGTNRSSLVGPPETQVNLSTSTAASSGIDRTPTLATSPAQDPNQPAVMKPGSGATSAEKSGVPLVLSLPETPISASGSVAISSQRSVPMPVDGTQAAKNGRNLQVGQLINLVEPVYPAEAVQQKIEGTVKLHAVIGTDGVIESLAQVSGPQILVNASMTAVRNWKYSPTRMNGQAIETQEDISFVFRLPN
jgi:TonB family protein